MAALAVIFIVAGVVAIALSVRGPAKSPGSQSAAGDQSPAGSQSPGNSQLPSPHPSTRISLSQAILTAGLTARWIDAQVSHGAVVACDNAMCEALAAAGFPGRHLKHIWSKSPYPSHAQVVVVTPVVQRQFGSKNARMAPPVLGRFGNGDTAIVVRVIAPQGAAKLRVQLKANQQHLRTAGASLLGKQHVTASPMAKKLLLDGRVDPRLIVVLTRVATIKPISIISFNANAAGVSPGVLFRTADLAPGNKAAGMSGTDYRRFLLTQLDKQPGVYHPLTFGIANNPVGQSVFRITFPAPSPLNLPVK
ncbi:MAG: hypothetical protein LBV34_13135 [Nocardiopsaceae bacterium]|nr:hypothetical protein [Nocardiopsaceae bacterium]